MNRSTTSEPGRLAALLTICCFFALHGANAAEPAEVAHLSWCADARDCLEWTPAGGAIAYDLHRGDRAGLAGLLTASPDSCAVGRFDSTTSGPSISATPAAGRLHWFLVSAWDGVSAGGSGSATAGPRVVDGADACAAPGTLLINEVDYDQPGIDFGEFVEIHNPGSSDQPLDGLVLVLVNGTTSAEYSRVDLGEAGATLPAGGYLVIGTPAVVASVPQGTLTVEWGASSNNVQNGSPDAVLLFDTSSGLPVDALSYEGAIHAAEIDGATGTFDLVDGTATSAADSSTLVGSLARHPNGGDTADDAADWGFTATPTPGAPNAP